MNVVDLRVWMLVFGIAFVNYREKNV